ncbi:LamG-like jellyroll fold domain-containing protein [Leptospira levettii]|uniref:LamG-like jellyroll fold domain-containing protein n=1 Tax=Leptospira levettii TaxID=2023178 RepID=UPI000C2B17B0|nr:LamG-like jellyroll fold domain-containing protein [Leptospira levettii]PJZ90648.1 glucanase [Leptospira levettii]
MKLLDRNDWIMGKRFLQKIIISLYFIPVFGCSFPTINRSLLETFTTFRFLQANTLSYSIRFQVSGLLGTGLQIENNGEVMDISSNGTYTFTKKINSGATYHVTVKTPPSSPIQNCIVSSGQGTVLNGNIEGIQVVCGSALYLISGTATGLSGNGLQLQNVTGAGTDVINVNSANFSFPPLPVGETYNFSIISQPTNPSQTCSITTPAVTNGTMVASPISASINCTTNSYVVSAQVIGILGTLTAGNELKLTLDGSNTINVTADGTYAFPGTYLSGGNFTVTVDNPGGVITSGVCTLSSGTVTVGNGATNFAVNCSNAFLVSGTVSSPGGTTTSVLGGSVTLDLVQTGGSPAFPTQSITINPGVTNFTFPSTIPGGVDYQIVVFANPPNQTCTITAGATHSGIVSNMSNVVLNCSLTLPSFSPVSGSLFNDDGTVTISSLIPGSEYRYTIGNGAQADPTCATGTMTTSTVNLTDNNQAVIKVIHCKVGWVESQVVTASYTLKVATPTPSLATGSFLDSGQNISFSSTTTGSTWVCHTAAAAVPTDPDCGSSLNTCNTGVLGNYIFPTPGVSQNVKARMCKVNYAQSDVLSINYQPNVYTVGGTISSLTTPFGTNTFILQNNGGDDLIIASNGTFTFNTALPTGTNFSVSVLSGPQNPWQTCNITNANGTVSNTAITNIAISCSVNQYNMSGNVTSSVILPTGLTVTNGVDSINVPAGATSTPIAFATPISSGTGYEIQITQEPPGFVCAVQSNIQGTMLGANITNVTVNCVAGYRYGNAIGLKKQAPVQIHYYKGDVTTAAGVAGSGSSDGPAPASSFNDISGITYDGTKGFIVDSGNHKIRVFNPMTNTVSSLVGSGAAGNTPGSGLSGTFNLPKGITTDGTYLYVTETLGNRIKRILISSGYAETFAGDDTVVSPANANLDATDPLAARFASPAGIVIDDNKLYIADRNNSAIRVIKLSTREVTTLVTGGDISFPEGLTIIGDYLYATNLGTYNITKTHKVTGVTTILCGNSMSGYIDAVGTDASFNLPHGITSDGIFLYVADYGNHLIRRVHSGTGEVITIAGSGNTGLINGVGVSASIQSPKYISNLGDVIVFGTVNALRTIKSESLQSYFPLNGSISNFVNNQTITSIGSPTFGNGRFNELNGAASTSIGNAGTAPSPSLSVNKVTMAGWILWDGTNSGIGKVIFYNGDFTSNGHGLFIDAKDQLAIYRGGMLPDSTNVTVIPNLWTHVALTVDSNDLYKVYLNGNLVFEKTLSTNPVSGNFTIGVSSAGSFFFPGRLADLRFYNRELNEAEVNDLAKNAESTLVGNSYASRPIQLAVQYQFTGDSTSKGPLGGSLSFYGPLTNYSTGINKTNNTAVRISASSGGYLLGSEQGLPHGTQPRSICVWVNLETYPNMGDNAPLITYGGAGPSTEFILNVYRASPTGDLKLRFGGLGGGELYPSYTLPLNRWTHICGTFDGNNGWLYVDGVEISGPVNIGSSINTTTGTGLYVGRMASFPGHMFGGKVDELKIYAKALTQKEVRTLSAQIPNGLVARYDFNKNFDDVSGFGNPTTSVGATLVSDKYGNGISALNTNGITYLNVNTTTSSLPKNSQPRTICVQYKSAALNAGTMISIGPNATDRMIALGAGNTSSKYFFSGYLNDVEEFYYNHENVWHHLCGVFEGPAGSYAATIYHNGAKLISQNKNTWDTNPNVFTIGIRSDLLNGFNGQMDEVLVYNRALSMLEIQALSGYDPKQVITWNANPTTSSLKLHLSADSFSNQSNFSPVNTWHDRSGNAASFFAGGSPPTYNNTGFNNKPTVNFNAGNSEYLFRGSAANIPSNSSTFFIAFSRTSNSNDTFFESATPGVSYYFDGDNIRMAKPSDGIVGSSNIQFPYTNIPYLIAAEQLNGVSFGMFSSGYAIGIPTDPSKTYSQNNLYLGSNSSPGNFFSGNISEVLYYNVSLSNPGRTIVFCYLSQKYNIDLSAASVYCD